MEKILISPSKYIQGKGAIHQVARHVTGFGQRAFAITDPMVLPLVEDSLATQFAGLDMHLTLSPFHGQCSRNEIERLVQVAKEEQAQVIMGIGGGKALDTAKSVAYYLGLPVVIIPTIASTDAPTSSLAVIYTEQGEFSEYLFFPANPNMVLVDSEIVAKAPVRLLVAGMGDALATYFEARATIASGKATMAGGLATKAAFAIAQTCYQTLMEDGYSAMMAGKQGLVTPAMENIIEANTYLSGIGFESCGLAAAHAIHNGLTVLEECHHLYHGEKVAFSTLVQLVLENAPKEEFAEVLAFCRQVGLPTNLHEMGVTTIDLSQIMAVSEMACAEGETIHNMPFPVSADQVYAAILTTHALTTA
ncbi:glycerol dehydrogenase [Vibrio metschnikovii]|uniref:glycerol dehydrogenase n=1 Tax=Vibrio metschnikovii TaxID=28172 RepID=UPI001C30F888|nr:glycerol dehydrogenase [Vibrio metschnikovii]